MITTSLREMRKEHHRSLRLENSIRKSDRRIQWLHKKIVVAQRIAWHKDQGHL